MLAYTTCVSNPKVTSFINHQIDTLKHLFKFVREIRKKKNMQKVRGVDGDVNERSWKTEQKSKGNFLVSSAEGSNFD